MAETKQNDWRQVLLGFFLLVILVVLAGVIVWSILNALISLPSAISPVVIAGIFTAFGSVLSLILSKQWEQSQAIAQEHRKQKIPIYEEFMAFWFKGLLAQKTWYAPCLGG